MTPIACPSYDDAAVAQLRAEREADERAAEQRLAGGDFAALLAAPAWPRFPDVAAMEAASETTCIDRDLACRSRSVLDKWSEMRRVLLGAGGGAP